LYNKLGIRVSTDAAFGRGHLVRCLEIRKHIINPVIWFIDFKNHNIIDFLPIEDEVISEESINSNAEVKKYIDSGKINALLIDSYNVSDKYKNILSKLIPIAVIIDKKSKVYAHTIILPQLLHFHESNATINLIGPEYAPIDSAYYNINNGTMDFNKKPISILVSMGYFDSKGITIKILKAIELIIYKFNYDIVVNVVIGNESLHLVEINTFKDKNSKLFIHNNVRDMSLFYKNSDIAIGATGLSNMERLAAGLPTLLIAQNKDQNNLINNLVKNGYALTAKNTLHSIEKAIIQMFSSSRELRAISRKGVKLVDGKGAKRIAKSINNILFKC
jgi:spore coat polysaccharide biosynthesis predicted glycosyltransferase SpsG